MEFGATSSLVLFDPSLPPFLLSFNQVLSGINRHYQ